MRIPPLKTRRRACLGFAVVLGLAGLTGCEPPADGGPVTDGVRGIVLVTVDGLVADRLSIWGGPVKSAGLESLAAEGRGWPAVWTPCPMTRPAAASYLTGQSPDRHGVVDDVFSTLPDDIPTLATRLGQLGFRTAAFPDSSFVGLPSGLLRGFEVWDEPPRPNLAAARWLPATKRTSVQVEAFRSWLEGLGPGERYFGWVHVTRPVLAQLGDGEDGPPPEILEDFVAAIDAVVDAASGPGVAVAVIGTFGDAGGADDGLAGIGYSLDERAVAVPLIARFPGGIRGARAPDAPVWGVDLTATLARLGGATLQAGEGIDLFEPRTADDPMFTFSWATLDQMGWKAQRAVRMGTAKRIEGLETVTHDVDDPSAEIGDELDRRLQQALALRAEPPRTQVPMAAVLELLEANELKLQPVPAGGRDFASHPERASVTRAMWNSRRGLLRGDPETTFSGLREIRKLDPDNLGALLDFGQLLLQSRPKRARPLLRRAAELYPGNPECLHWLAHSMWADDWREGEKILEAALPYMPHDRDVLYDLACARSLAEDLDASETYLRTAIEAGYREWQSMEVDADLRHLRESGRFARVMQEYRR